MVGKDDGMGQETRASCNLERVGGVSDPRNACMLTLG